jgi:hypothetical protein
LHKFEDYEMASLLHLRAPDAMSSSTELRRPIAGDEPPRDLYIPSVLSQRCEAGFLQPVKPGAGERKGVDLKEAQQQALHAGALAAERALPGAVGGVLNLLL